MLPAIKGMRLAEAPWHEFSFDTVLHYYDGPRMLLQRGRAGETYLALWNDEDDTTERWICIPVGLARLRGLLSGQVRPRDAIDHPEYGHLLVVDIDLDTDAVIQLVSTDSSALPPESLPKPEATFAVADSTIDQIIGPHLSEPDLLNIAHAYQQATEWHQQRPGI